MHWARMEDNFSDILIIGAGMAGLTCATGLAAAGRNVRVLDKGRGPGGRMAARRAQVADETVSFDHGAQYFTARDDGFESAVASWQAAGAVAKWPAAGEEAWVGTPGMNGPIKTMAEPLDVRWSTRALSISREGDIWHVDAGEEQFTASTVLIAVPAEQAAELLEPIAPDLAVHPASIVSEPCWAVMVCFAASLPIEPDAMRDPEAPISWAARNSAKPGRVGGEGWVLHASPKRSREVLELPKEEVADELLADFFAQAGIEPVQPIHLAAHRWLYAMPASLKGEPSYFDAAKQIGIAGDYLHSPRVEGAWISGHSLANKVLG